MTEVEPALTPEQEAQKQRTLDLMERYYAEKAALAARVQRTRKERGLSSQTKETVEVPAEPEPVHETDQEKYERSRRQKGIWSPPQ